MEKELTNREYWNEKLTTYLADYFWDNFTDFNNSTCHTYFVASNENRFSVGSQALREFLFAGNVAYYVKIQISCKAPLVCVAFCKYDGSPTAFHISGNLYIQNQKEIYGEIERFSGDNTLQITLCSDMSEGTYQEYFETEA